MNIMKAAIHGGIGLGLGAVDEILERSDADAGKTKAFERTTDWARLGVAAVGIGIQWFLPKHEAIGTTIEGIGMFATAKSLAKTDMFAETAVQGRATTFVPRARSTPRSVGVNLPNFQGVEVV